MLHQKLYKILVEEAPNLSFELENAMILCLAFQLLISTAAQLAWLIFHHWFPFEKIRERAKQDRLGHYPKTLNIFCYI